MPEGQLSDLSFACPHECKSLPLKQPNALPRYNLVQTKRCGNVIVEGGAYTHTYNYYVTECVTGTTVLAMADIYYVPVPRCAAFNVIFGPTAVAWPGPYMAYRIHAPVPVHSFAGFTRIHGVGGLLQVAVVVEEPYRGLYLP